MTQSIKSLTDVLWAIKKHQQKTHNPNYLDPKEAQDFKEPLINYFRDHRTINSAELKSEYGIDIQNMTRSHAKNTITNTNTLTVFAVGITPKNAYVIGVNKIRSILEKEGITTNTFDHHLWTRYYHPEKIQLMVVQTDQKDKNGVYNLLYVLYHNNELQRH